MASVDVNVMVQEGLFSINDCAKKCLSTKSFTCDSFTYCQLAGECVLSNVHPDINKTAQTYSLACDLYIRRYTDKYVKYEGQTTQVQPDKTVHAVLSADVCAKNCYTNNEINCKSFDYCANTQTCYLKTSHILQISVSSVVTSSDCSHYSKMYLYDFVKTPNRVVSDGKTVSHILYNNVTAENCARLCVQNFGYRCKAFSFCGNASQCIIYSTQNLLTASQTNANNFCHLYTRQYFDDSGPSATQAPDTSSSSQLASTGYTSGAMAGIALAMLVVGMLLGVALLYFFRTKQLVQRREEREMKNVEPENETDS